MLKDITIGQFMPGNSVIHRLDARIKLVLTVLYMVALFMAGGLVGYGIVTATIVVMVAVSGVPVKMLVKSLKPLLILIIFSAILNIFYTVGTPLVSFSVLSLKLTVTKEGVIAAAVMVVRLMYLVICTSMLTYTTSPILLTDAIESLLSPLKRIKLPVHEFAMMMTIALRFIPTLIEETDKIICAQKARGADFETGGLIKRGKALVPILIPLFVSAFRRADELAVAMECRCYRGGEGRTRLKQYKLTAVDIGVLVTMILLFAAIIVLGRFGL